MLNFYIFWGKERSLTCTTSICLGLMIMAFMLINMKMLPILNLIHVPVRSETHMDVIMNACVCDCVGGYVGDWSNAKYIRVEHAAFALTDVVGLEHDPFLTQHTENHIGWKVCFQVLQYFTLSENRIVEWFCSNMLHNISPFSHFRSGITLHNTCSEFQLTLMQTQSQQPPQCTSWCVLLA